MNKIHALLIDDDDRFAGDFAALAENSFHVEVASSGSKGIETLKRQSPDVVLLDLRLGSGMDGLETLRRIKEIDEDLPVIMVTEHASVETAVQAIRMGATHYTFKAPNLRELKAIVEREIENVRWKILARRDRRLGEQTLVGRHPAMVKVREQIRRIAPTDAAVLVVGESGTGKELVAREIHRLSPRSPHSFVAVNCGNLAPERFESEFFGHEPGAFTGAIRRLRGHLECADGGTLFLDEVGTLPLQSQSKILRVLETKEFQRLGGRQTLYSDARIVAATNADLDEEVKRGNFREDLLHRLQAFTIELPPLRDRRDDIPLLAEHYLHLHALARNKKVTGFSDEALEKLCSHDWPGNVRALNQVIFAAVVCVEGPTITADVIELRNRGKANPFSMEKLFDLPYKAARREALRSFDRAYLVHWLQRCEGNITLVARETGVDRTTVYRKLQNLNGDRKR